jgi:hypothetical protein
MRPLLFGYFIYYNIKKRSSKEKTEKSIKRAERSALPFGRSKHKRGSGIHTRLQLAVQQILIEKFAWSRSFCA